MSHARFERCDDRVLRRPSVDGKAVARRSERALQVLTNAANAKDVQRELSAIVRETRRYEFNTHVMGITIHQGTVMRGHRDSFAIEWAGRDQIAGRDVVVIDYRQTGPVPRRGFELSLPREFGDPDPVHRGRLWLDAETFQLRRQVWELLEPHPARF